jgi:hypothetical protein
MKGMEAKRSSAAPILVAIVMLLAVVLGAYVGDYFLRGEVEERILTIKLSNGSYDAVPYRMRTFRTEWEVKIFQAAAMIESFVTGENVDTFLDHRILLFRRIRPAPAYVRVWF